MPELRGKCMCGAVQFTAHPPALEAGVCHCGQCSKWTGGMFINVYCADTIKFDAGAPVGSHKASEWGERLFCTTCGSSLIWQTQDGQHQSASIHCFDNPSQFTLTTQIFIDRKPDCYALANKTENMTEAEVFAKYAPDSA